MKAGACLRASARRANFELIVLREVCAALVKGGMRMCDAGCVNPGCMKCSDYVAFRDLDQHAARPNKVRTLSGSRVLRTEPRFRNQDLVNQCLKWALNRPLSQTR